jgi:streptogramin lyase
LFAACGSGSGGSTTRGATPGPISITTLPSAGTVSATIPFVGGVLTGYYLYGMAADDVAVWVHNAEQGTLVRVDPTTNKIVATIHVGHGVGSVVLEGGYVWVGNRDDSTVAKVDPRTNTVVDTIALPPPTDFLGVSPGAVWVAAKDNNTIRRIDAQTDHVVDTVISYGEPWWTTFGTGSLWVCNQQGFGVGVTRMDPVSSKVLVDIDLAPGKYYSCDAIAAADDGIWAELLDADVDLGLVRIDPATNKVVTTILLPQTSGPSALATDAHGVWLVRRDQGLLRVSPLTHRASGFLSVPEGVLGIAVGAGSVWAVNGNGTLLRITPAS